MKIGPIEIDLGTYTQKRFIGARFLIAMALTIGYLYGYVDAETERLVIAFYFASHIKEVGNVIPK